MTSRLSRFVGEEACPRFRSLVGSIPGSVCRKLFTELSNKIEFGLLGLLIPFQTMIIYKFQMRITRGNLSQNVPKIYQYVCVF